MNIEFPSSARIPRLRELWKKAFGDGDEFLDLFFAVAYSPRRCRCIPDGDRVAAALYWFETTCAGQRFAYIYAVATDPEYRGRGLCRLLMADTARILKGEGYQGILLHPAGEDLARMYEKMGYEACTTVSEFRCDAAGEPVALRKVDEAEYARLRRSFLGAGGVLQEGEDLALLASQADFWAGECFLAAVSADGEELHCHELLGDGNAAPGILTALGYPKGFFRTPGGEKKFAFLKILTPECVKPAYFGLALD